MIVIALIIAIGYVFDRATGDTTYSGVWLAIIISLVSTLISYFQGDKIALFTSGAKPLVKEDSKEMIDGVIQKTGEKVELGEVFEVTGPVVGNYVHQGKSAVIVSLEGGNTELAKDGSIISSIGNITGANKLNKPT
jgi:hypothetical protein